MYTAYTLHFTCSSEDSSTHSTTVEYDAAMNMIYSITYQGFLSKYSKIRFVKSLGNSSIFSDFFSNIHCSPQSLCSFTFPQWFTIILFSPHFCQHFYLVNDSHPGRWEEMGHCGFNHVFLIILLL